MPLRLSSPTAIGAAFRRFQSKSPRSALRAYSSNADDHPLIVVSDIPAPNTGIIRVLELNRPAARNALSVSLVKSLWEHVRAVSAWYDGSGELDTASSSATVDRPIADQPGPVRALVIASALDSCFCAGADLKERRTQTLEQTKAFLSDLRGVFTALSLVPVPTISAISSVALGGGLELALATHFRVLSSNATIGLPETRLGIIPGAGGTYRLPAIIGRGRARELILTGRRVSAHEAYTIGLADRVVEVLPEEEGQEHKDEAARKAQLLTTARWRVLVEAIDLAEQICAGGPVAIRAALQAVDSPSEERENKMYETVLGTEDRNEALTAFAEKRKPKFLGR